MMVCLDHIKVKFDYQGHRLKVKVTFVKMIILTVGHQIILLQSTYDINMIIKVKVMLRSRSFQNQIVSVWISIPKVGSGSSTEGILFFQIFPSTCCPCLQTKQVWYMCTVTLDCTNHYIIRVKPSSSHTLPVKHAHKD